MPCPFQGAFTFTYKEGGRACDKVSEVVECANPSQALLKFQPCSEVEVTEAGGSLINQIVISPAGGDVQKTLTCKATWQDDRDCLLYTSDAADE